MMCYHRMMGVIIGLLFIAMTSAYAAPASQQENSLYFLSLSDIHFDPFAACHRMTPCPVVTQLRQAAVEKWPSILAQYDTSLPHYGQDTNFKLLQSSLAAARQAALTEHVQFVLVLGDFLAHSFHEQYKRYTRDKSVAAYQSFTRKTLAFLALMLARTFPEMDVYSAIGNNDSYRGNYYYSHSDHFFADVGQLWAPLIKTPANRAALLNNFSASGCYAVDVPGRSSYRLIVLNSVLFSNNARGKHVDEAAQKALAWLTNQLSMAKTNHQKVFIAMHIPMGTDVFAAFRIRLFRLMELWKQPYTARFQALLQEYAMNIEGVFSGHLHSDWFQTESYGQNDIPMTGTIAISPVYGNNPGFKIYSFDPRFQLKEFAAYSFTLMGKKMWDKEYSLNHICTECDDTDQNYIDQLLEKFVRSRQMKYFEMQPRLPIKQVV